jgi:hypothetical protein
VDLFSLGVVMYEMATRRVPFLGATAAIVSAKLLGEAPEPVRSWNGSVPRDLEKIILQLLAKHRAARFQTASEVAEALHRMSVQSGSGWLERVQRTPVVPLVQAQDPVAWRRRKVQDAGSRPDVPMMLPAPEPQPEQDARLIRPLRMGTKESGPRESAYNPERAGKTGSGATMRWQVVGFCPKLRRGLVWWIWQQRRRRLRLRGEVEESAKRRMRWLRLVMGRGLKLQRPAPRLKIWESRRLRPRGRRLRVELRWSKCLRGRCLRPGER